jgi:hypothetical protein
MLLDRKLNTLREKNNYSATLKKIKKDPEESYQLASNFLKNFDILGYNLNSEYIYANPEFDTWNWKTTQNKTFYKTIWNIKQKKYVKIPQIYSLHNNILYHCFPLELKNKTEKKLNYISYTLCGSDIKSESNILILDIDNHNNLGTLAPYEEWLKLKKLFSNNIIYMEMSAEYGFHIYIKLNKNYSAEDKKEYLDKIKNEHDLKFTEIPSRLRFPCSYHYQCCDIELQPKDPFINLQEIPNKYKNIKSLKLNIYQNYKPSIIYSRQKKSEYISHYKFLNSTDIIISEGNRHLPMLKICRISKYNQWTLQDTIKVIRQLDIGSKDLKKWDDKKLETIIKNIQEKSRLKPIENISNRKPDTYKSNSHLIPSQILNLIQSEDIIFKLIQESNYKLTPLNQLKFKETLIEMIGTLYYNTQNPKQAVIHKLLIGTQFSETYCNLLSEYLSEKFNITIDCLTIVKSILKNKKIFQQYFSNKRGWLYSPDKKEYNFCKQYDFQMNKRHALLNKENILSFFISITFKTYNSESIKLLTIHDFLYNNTDIIPFDTTDFTFNLWTFFPMLA